MLSFERTEIRQKCSPHPTPTSHRENVPAVRAALGQEGVAEGIDYRGKPVIADVRAVPDSPWFLVARTDIEEVYARCVSACGSWLCLRSRS